jgi:6-phosphogluconate dehydrogenase
MKYNFGMIGLGVMGRNFLLNVADNNYSAYGLDTDAEKVAALKVEGQGKQVDGTTDMATFVKNLETPRKIMLLVPAGKVVDIVINDLLNYVEEGDLIIDGGNSHYNDTTRRVQELEPKGIHFIGVGVSGGAKGARFGPSIMPGGNAEAYAKVAPIFEAVSAKVGDDPCVAHMGKGAAGHYVKMVHNGIEYGLMQLLAEAYDLLKQVGGLNNQEIHSVFSEWNAGRLRSFLVEITAAIFAQKDELTDGDLIDKILDKAKQKGTGKWTSQNAMDIGIPIPTIDSAVTMRGLSALKQERVAADAIHPSPLVDHAEDKAAFIAQLEEATYFAFLVTYAQGLALLADASTEMDLDLNLETTAKIWRGGCIIRADLLEIIRRAYTSNPDLANLMLAEELRKDLAKAQNSMREVLKAAIDRHIPLLTMGSTLHYYDAYHTGRLPLNLVQAQRDYFGSHTYERVDREGIFHTEW